MTTPTPRIQRLEGTIKVMAPPMGNPKGMSVVREATCVMVDELDKLETDLAAREAELAEALEWKEVLLNELIIDHIYTKEHETNPRKAIHDAITWNCQVALDPAVSSDAQKLRDTHLQRAEAAEKELSVMTQMAGKNHAAWKTALHDRDGWKSKAEEAAMDSARLDWMIEHGTDEGGGSGFEFRVYIPHDSECLRDAIDAALAAKGEA